MQPIEFDTQIVNGMLIVPPGVFGDAQGNVHVSVSVPISSMPDSEKSLLRHLLENPIGKSDFVPLTREEANDRHA